MISIMSADIRRILHKKSFNVILIILIVHAIYNTVWDKFHVWNGFVFATNTKTVINGIVIFVLSLLILVGVYADEFTSKSMQVVIGRGISRLKYIYIKMLDCIILTVGLFLAYFILVMILSLIFGAHMDGTDIKIIFCTILVNIFVLIWSNTISAFILYASNSIPFAVVVQVVLIGIIPTFISMAGSKVLFHNNRIHDLYITGLANRAFTDMMLGTGGLLPLLIGTVIYLGAGFLLSFLVFRKKEMEF